MAYNDESKSRILLNKQGEGTKFANIETNALLKPALTPHMNQRRPAVPFYHQTVFYLLVQNAVVVRVSSAVSNNTNCVRQPRVNIVPELLMTRHI